MRRSVFAILMPRGGKSARGRGMAYGSHNNGKWVKLEGYCTGASRTVTANAGIFVNSRCTGKVWFDDMCLKSSEKNRGMLYSSAYRDIPRKGR